MYKEAWQSLLNRPKESNKYDFGHVLVIGGSPGMEGAPLLAAKSALKTGAGLVTIASIDSVVEKIAGNIPEVMTLGLSSFNKEQSEKVLDFIKNRHVSTLVIGPGISLKSKKFIHNLLIATDLPTVIDAGGLAAFEDNLEILNKIASKNKNIVLTPHPGEFSRLINKIMPKLTDSQNKLAANFAKDHHVTIILKHALTFIAHKDGGYYKNQSGNTSLATAGTGDVLAGIIAGIIAQKTPFESACEMAVYLHGLAADLAIKEKTIPGLMASDVIDFIPQALNSIQQE